MDGWMDRWIENPTGYGGLFLSGMRGPGREADPTPPYCGKANNDGTIPPLPQYVFMAWYLVKNKDNFTFTFVRVTYKKLIL
jgi:hypothetical protein